MGLRCYIRKYHRRLGSIQIWIDIKVVLKLRGLKISKLKGWYNWWGWGKGGMLQIGKVIVKEGNLLRSRNCQFNKKMNIFRNRKV